MDDTPAWAQADLPAAAAAPATADSTVPSWAQGEPSAPAIKSAPPAQSESQFYHNAGRDEELEKFPNVKETGAMLPVKTTYNPDGTVDSSRMDWNMPLKNLSKGVGDLYQQAENKSTDTTPEGVNAMLALSGLPSVARTGARALGEIGENAAASLARPAAEKALPKNVQDYAATQARNTQYVEGINQTANNVKDAYDNSYNKAAEISQGVSIKAPKIRNNVSDLLEDLKDDPAHSSTQGSSQAFRDMQAVEDSFHEDGSIDLDKITLLQRRVNDLYSPDMSATRGKIYSTLNQQLKDIVKRAKEENPEWGTLMDSGNNLFKNYKNTFANDTQTASKWSLDDQKDYDRWKDQSNPESDNHDPFAPPPLTETRNKLSDITSVNNVAQYEAMLRKIPPELHDQFTQDVIAANKEARPNVARKIGLAYSAAKGNAYGVIKNLYKMSTDVPTPEWNVNTAQQFPHVNDAVSHYTDLSNTAHQTYLDKLQAAQEKQQIFRDAVSKAQKALPAPSQAYLPAPESAMIPTNESYTSPLGVSDRPYSGQVRPQTVAERDAAIAARQNPDNIAAERARVELPNPYPGWSAGPKTELGQVGQRAAEQGGWDKAAENLKSLGYTYKEIVGKIGVRPTFARGGAVVDKDPTPAQKVAGNYKKHHISFHGLNISIENPKGSKRRGKDKDGKEWVSVMPDHYGYIRRTVGADDGHMDCYIGDNKNSNRIYVIDQRDMESGRFDEHKVMLGYGDRDDATKAYRAAFSDKKNRIMKITRLTISEFKDWLKNGDTKQPFKRTA